jgi:inosine/xanthosine triphosphate pyrophosphatase family protein
VLLAVVWVKKRPSHETLRYYIFIIEHATVCLRLEICRGIAEDFVYLQCQEVFKSTLPLVVDDSMLCSTSLPPSPSAIHTSSI